MAYIVGFTGVLENQVLVNTAESQALKDMRFIGQIKVVNIQEIRVTGFGFVLDAIGHMTGS